MKQIDKKFVTLNTLIKLLNNKKSRVKIRIICDMHIELNRSIFHYKLLMKSYFSDHGLTKFTFTKTESQMISCYIEW